MYSSVICPPLPFGAMLFRLSIFASSASVSKNYNFFNSIFYQDVRLNVLSHTIRIIVGIVKTSL